MNAQGELNQELSETDKAFTRLMYPGRTPTDMTLKKALEIAKIDDRTAGNITRSINTDKNYAAARKTFIDYNKAKVVEKLKSKPYSDHS